VFEDEEKIFDAIRAGASGYILKKTAPHLILEAIRELNGGGAPLSPVIARRLVAGFQKEASEVPTDYQLTTREKEILFSLIDGLSYMKIADKYFISISTVRTHICAIYQKLHVHSRSQAAAKIRGR